MIDNNYGSGQIYKAPVVSMISYETPSKQKSVGINTAVMISILYYYANMDGSEQDTEA